MKNHTILKRYAYILSFVGAALFLWIPSIPAVTLKIATQSPDGSYWMKAFRRGAQEVTLKTARQVKFKFYPGGVMGDERAVIKKIRIGQLHGGAVTSGSLSNFFRDNRVYNLPMLFNSMEEVDYVRHRMDPIIIDGLYKGGFVTFGLAGGGFAYLMSKVSISSITELQKHKAWVPQNDMIAYESARAFGVTPIPLSVPEVRTALQTGMLDTVSISPIAAIALRWHTQVNYVTDIPLIYLYAVLALDRRVFDKISEKNRKIIASVMTDVFKEIDRKNREDSLTAIEVLRNQGIVFVKPDAAEQLEWRRRASAVPQRMIETGRMSQKIVDQLQQHLKDYRTKRSALNAQQ
jgi:TRAP-type C4-dicarboxylate transport system substrate-binding protein